jgi:hypothetical protein
MARNNKLCRRMPRVFISCLILFFIVSCVRTVITEDKSKTRTPRRESYQKLKDYKFDLNLVHPGRSFAPTDEITLNFRLKNLGDKPVRIDEWFMSEPDNLRIYYRPWQKNIFEFDKNDKNWKCIEPVHAINANRFELIVSPGNVVFIEKKLNLSKSVAVVELTGKRYLIVAELALTSVDVRSGVFEIDFK